MLLEELMRVTFPHLPKEAWPNAANLNLYREKWQSIGGEDLELSPRFAEPKMGSPCW